MSGFDEREKAQEAKFAHDAQLQFKAEARRNKLLALWAASLIKHPDPDAYVGEVIASDFEEAGDDDVFRKVSADLLAADQKISDEELRAKMNEFMPEARDQVLSEA